MSSVYPARSARHGRGWQHDAMQSPDPSRSPSSGASTEAPDPGSSHRSSVGWDIVSGPGLTALGLAAARLVESGRPDRLVDDPLGAVFLQAVDSPVPFPTAWPEPGQEIDDRTALHLHGSRYIGLRTRTSGATAALSGWTQSTGYLMAALGPFGVGLLHEATDAWTVPLLVLTGLSVPLFAVGLYVARPAHIEDQLRA